ncbi:MAG: hypothetical protein ACI9EF_003568 [Pseudohongiellaceae bacterium]|jgi:hypothetical protein
MPRLFALVLCLASVGCGLSEPLARGRDLGQVVHLGISGSYVPGLYVWALAPLLGTSIGYQPQSAVVGSDYGYTHGWHQAGYGIVVGGEMARSEWGFSVDGFIERPLWNAYATQTQLLVMNLTVTDQRLGKDSQSIALRRAELGLHLLFVGASLGLDFFALGDFVAGWFGFDPSDDDHRELLRAPFNPLKEADDKAPQAETAVPSDS